MSHGIVPDNCSLDVRASESRYAVWLAEMDAMTERDEGLCYFIGSAAGHIKIGYSKDIWRQFTEVRNSVPFEIEMLATVRGGRYREGYYHHKFAASRAFGEWFTRTPEIEAEIARLVERCEA